MYQVQPRLYVHVCLPAFMINWLVCSTSTQFSLVLSPFWKSRTVSVTSLLSVKDPGADGEEIVPPVLLTVVIWLVMVWSTCRIVLTVCTRDCRSGCAGGIDGMLTGWGWFFGVTGGI